jgi:FAD synthetase
MKKLSKEKINKVVLVGGCFDILHYGHIHFLKKAKALGDYLIVALESDKNIKRLKGEGRPVHNQSQRRKMLESLHLANQVVVLADEMKDEDYSKFVTIISPDIIAITKGDPITGKKRKQAEEAGATLIEIPKIKSPSTTDLVKLLKIQ